MNENENEKYFLSKIQRPLIIIKPALQWLSVLPPKGAGCERGQ
jgi:hypothetical protein